MRAVVTAVYTYIAYVMCECWPCTAVNPASRDQDDSGESEMRVMDDDVG